MKKSFVFFLLVNFVLVFISAQSYVSNIRTLNGLWGYINMQGETLLEAKYDNAKPFSDEGLALVRDVGSKEFYYINIKGQKLELDCSPVAMKKFQNGRAMVKVGEKWGYIDTNGSLVIPAAYAKVSYFSNDRAFVRDENKNVFLIDLAGEKIDLNGLKILASKEFTEGLARVKVGSTWGYLNAQGEMVIDAKYSKVGEFHDGLAYAKIGKGEVGYINKQGEYIIEPQFAAVSDFDPSTGMARVKIGKSWMYIDKAGNKLTVDADHFHDFSDGLLRADKNSNPGVYGFVNTKGEWVIEPQFEKVGNFHFGVCRVRKNEMWGLIDKEGNELIKPQYDRFEDFEKLKP